MSNFINSYEMYERVCKISGDTPTQEAYDEIIELTKKLTEIPEEKQFIQTNYNKEWEEFRKEFPDKTLDDFFLKLNSK